MDKLEYSYQSNWRGRLHRYAPVLFWLGVIIYLSTGAGASTETSRFIGPLIDLIYPQADAITRATIHSTVRKCAHFTEYGVFALIVSRAFLTSSKHFLRKYWHIGAVMSVAVLATIDEGGQSFDPTRTGSIYDILIDIVGGISAVVVIALLRHKWPLNKLFTRTEINRHVNHSS